MKWLSCAVALLTLASATPALAQEVLPELPDVKLERIPPQYSYDLGIQFGFGEVSYWREDIPVWASLGFFGSWGAHINGNDRIGPGLAVVVEGDVPLHTSVAFEPTVRWDRVQGKLALGAAAGGALMIHAANKPTGNVSAFTVNPVLAARIGWSQGWTRVGRRLFIVLEPKVRLVEGRLGPSVAVQVGSGHGY